MTVGFEHTMETTEGNDYKSRRHGSQESGLQLSPLRVR